METKLAEASLYNVALRDPTATDHKMTFAELQNLAPHFDWDGYFKAANLSTADLNVDQPKFLEEVDRQLREVPLADWKTYLKWQALHSFAGSLSAPIVEENYNFYGAYLEGTERTQAALEALRGSDRRSARRGRWDRNMWPATSRQSTRRARRRW